MYDNEAEELQLAQTGSFVSLIIPQIQLLEHAYPQQPSL